MIRKKLDFYLSFEHLAGFLIFAFSVNIFIPLTSNTSKHLLPGLHSFKIKQNEINPNFKAHLLHEKQYPERPIFITS